MTAHATPNASALIDLLSEQRDLYGQLQALCEKQTVFIEQGETEQLLALLSKRQGLVDMLGRINGELVPFRENWDGFCSALPDASRTRLRQLLEDVGSRLEDILSRDEQAQNQLRATQQRIGGELTQVSRAGSALQAYRGPHQAPPEARFTDNQG